MTAIVSGRRTPCTPTTEAAYSFHAQRTHHHHHHHRFNVLLSALARVGRFSKMLLLQTARSCASSRFNFNLLISSATHSFHVFLPLPFPLFPVTTMFLHAGTQSLASLRSTCPNHLNLPWHTMSDTPTIPSLSLSTSLEFPSFRVTPHIHLIIIFSALSNRCMSSTCLLYTSPSPRDG